MAKGSAMGLWKGKKGSSVFYQIKNSNSLQKQGVRERNYEPANPRSISQAGQRMRMYPAQAVYGVLKETIERSWQGVKYGQMTRQAYLKSALRSEVFPSISKGDGVIVPGPYQIAKGSLQEVPVNLQNGAVRFGFLYADGLGQATVGSLSQEILAANPSLRAGDQITIVICYTVDASVVQLNWNVGSFYLNTEDTTPLDWENCDWIPQPFEVDWNAQGLGMQPRDDAYIYATSCIVSREGSTPLRSNASLAVDTTALPEYYGVEARARARRSYMNPLTIQSTDWPVDPGEGGGGSAGDDYTITVNQVTTQSGGTEDPTPGGVVSGGGSYLIGERVTLTATPDGSHVFTGWYPSKEDALANTNRISTAGIFIFVAGDQYADVTTFFGKFQPQL